MKQAPRFIRLRPTTSRLLASFIVGSHSLAGLALFLSDLDDTSRILLLVLVMLGCYFGWSRFIDRTGARAIVGADWLPDGNWRLSYGKGDIRQVASWSVLLNTPVLLMLSFRGARDRVDTLIICPDNVDAETRRQLRVRLETCQTA